MLLIAGLGAQDFTVRDWCQSALELSPESAGPLIWHDTTDPEVNWRLRRLRDLWEPAWLPGEWTLSLGGERAWVVRLDRGGGGTYAAASSPRFPSELGWHYVPGTLTLYYYAGAEVYHLTPARLPGRSPLSRLPHYVWSRPGRSFHARLQSPGNP